MLHLPGFCFSFFLGTSPGVRVVDVPVMAIGGCSMALCRSTGEGGSMISAFMQLPVIPLARLVRSGCPFR